MENKRQTIQLNQFVRHQKGFAFKSKDYVSSGIPVVRVSNFTDDSIDTADFKYVTSTIADDKAIFELVENDVVIATVGSWPKNPASVVGKVIRVPPEATPSLLNQNAVILKPISNERYDKDFLYYILKNKNFSDYIVSTAQGSANQASITLKDIYAYSFSLPHPQERKAISQTLRKLDNKITLNRQINQTLEHMAQALFKSWFVDFDPVVDNALDAGFFEQDLAFPDELLYRAEARKAVCENADFKPLPENIRQLFPAAFEECSESSLGLGGWVPRGWDVKRLEEILELAYGKALKKTDRVNGDYPVYGSGGVDGTHISSLVDGPGIVVGRKGTVGSLYWESKNFHPIDTVFYVKPKSGFTLFYCYELLKTLGLEEMNTDAAVPGLNRNNAYRLLSVIPDNTVLDELSKILSSYRHRIELCKRENLKLTNLRETLLPKLISGELCLVDCEIETTDVEVI